MKSGLGLLLLLQPFAPVIAPPITEPQILKLERSDSTVHQGQCIRFILRISAQTSEDSYFLETTHQKIPFFAVTSHNQTGVYQALLAIKADLKPDDYPLSITNQAGQQLLHDTLKIKAGNFYTQALKIRRPKPSAQEQALVEQEDKLVDQARKLSTPETFWKEPFILPVPQRVNAAFGTRRYLNGHYNGYHSGVDFASPMGYPVKAPAAAQVSLARYFSVYNSNGNTVFLNHGQGVSSVYIHLSKIAVKENDFVKKGQIIGYIGTTGRSTGPHLHWSMYLNGQNMDGLYWIRFSERLLR